MLTLNVSQESWDRTMNVAVKLHSYELPRGGSGEETQMIDRMVRAALRELKIEVEVAE